MKRHFRFLFTTAMMFAISLQALQAADTSATVDALKASDYSFQKKFIHFGIGSDVMFNIGLRAGLDLATFSTDYTDMDSGFRVTDGTIQAEVYYRQNLSFHLEFNVYGDSERDAYFRYKIGQTHTVKAGFFRDPSSLSLNTTQDSYRFVARPTTASILMNDDRVFGLSYKYVKGKLYAEQAIFVKDGPDNSKLETKFEDMGFAGRWLYKPFSSETSNFHVGLNTRYVNYSEPVTVTLAGCVATNYDDENNFFYASLDDVKQDLSIGAEAMYVADKYFVRGEYTNRIIMKSRDDEALFTSQLEAGETDFTTLSSWQAGNPIRTNNFSGFYVEGGYLLIGDRYIYDESRGQVASHNMRGALEIVARYECTLLNDITSGDVFARKDGEEVGRFYQNGNPYDLTSLSSSVGGGNLHAATVGVNYYISRGVIAMLDYTYNRLKNPYFENDSNISVAQLRLFIKF